MKTIYKNSSMEVKQRKCTTPNGKKGMEISFHVGDQFGAIHETFMNLFIVMKMLKVCRDVLATEFVMDDAQRVAVVRGIVESLCDDFEDDFFDVRNHSGKVTKQSLDDILEMLQKFIKE